MQSRFCGHLRLAIGAVLIPLLVPAGAQAQSVDLDGLPPVELMHAVARNTPVDESIANTQRTHEHANAPREQLDRCLVEMIVVIVRKDHTADRR